MTHTSEGVYQFTASGLGVGCPVPAVNAFAQTSMFLDGGNCGGMVTTAVRTVDGLDHPWAYTRRRPGTDPVAASTARAVETTIDLPANE